MKLHLVGLPVNAHRRLKDASDGWTDAVPEPHLFRATPAPTASPRPFDAGLFKEIESAIAEGFTHIAIPASRDWRNVARLHQFNCRVHILRFTEPFSDLDWTALKGALHTIVELEVDWLKRISPKDLRHALLLPPTHFNVHRDASDFWKRCDVYERPSFETAESLLTQVERQHRRNHEGAQCWIDGKKRCFRFDLSLHARTAAERQGSKSYRFCFELPPGFHYDVVHQDGAHFDIAIGGKFQSVAHVNISPFGNVRKG